MIDDEGFDNCWGQWPLNAFVMHLESNSAAAVLRPKAKARELFYVELYTGICTVAEIYLKLSGLYHKVE